MDTYELKYKNALEWARQVMNGETGFIREEVVYVFPELAESEDERISREITEFILTHRIDEPNDIEDTKPWLVWLEKQGEQKEINPTLQEKERMDDAFTKMMLKPQVDGFDAELNALLKKYEHLPKKELQEPLEFYLGVVRDDLDIVREEKPKWSDEDEIGSDATIELLEYFINYAPEFRRPTIRRSIDWLKSLKKRMEE